MANFGDIRALLQQGGETIETWHKLSQSLLGWYGREPLEEVAQYCASHVDHWSVELPTVPPAPWFTQPHKALVTNPVHDFFSHCIVTRHEKLREDITPKIEASKALKTPRFIDASKLGALRWRTGEELDEKTSRRVLTWMRNACMTHGNADLQRLRMLLDDEDCQRWSRRIYKDWMSAGCPSPHRWALHMVAYWGTLDILDAKPSTFTHMAAVRAQQYFDVIEAFESKEGYTLLARVALETEQIYYRVRELATQKINAVLDRDALSPQRFLATKTHVDEPFYDTLRLVYKGMRPWVVREKLELALGDQREVPGWVLNAILEQETQQGAGFSSIVFKLGDTFTRIVDGAFVGLHGEPVEVKDRDFLTLAHPAHFSDDELFNAWRNMLLDETNEELHWLQFERDVYGTDTPLEPEGGIEVPRRNSLESSTLVEGGARADDYGFIHIFYDAPEYTIYVIEYDGYGDYCINTHGHRIQWTKGARLYPDILVRIGEYGRHVDDPAIHSELCRRVRITDARLDATMPKSRRKTRTPRMMPR